MERDVGIGSKARLRRHAGIAQGPLGAATEADQELAH